MRHCFFGTNMKKYKSSRDTEYFIHGLTEALRGFSPEDLTLFIIPSFPSLKTAGELLKNSPILLGAQNKHWEEEGQFSGEVSARMLKELHVSMVMIGHSERRHIFHETDEELNKKVLSAVNHGLIPLLCIGETAAERSAGCADEVLRIQLKKGLYGFPKEKLSMLRLAYEPVWAIGVSGTPAPADYVGESHAAIRSCLAELFEEEGNTVPLLFGGSVNPQNASGYLAQPNVDGLFVGRSAWTPDGYADMVRRFLI